MAIQVSNPSQVNFGTVTGSHTITHIRFREANNDEIATKQLDSSVSVVANNALTIDMNDIDLIYEDGQFPDSHIEKVVKLFYGATGQTSVKVDLLTNSTTPVSDSGYTQQTVTGWTYSTI